MKCSNCEAPLTGVFCGACGTRNTASQDGAGNGGDSAQQQCASCSAAFVGRFCPACGHDSNLSTTSSAQSTAGGNAAPRAFQPRSFGGRAGGGPLAAAPPSAGARPERSTTMPSNESPNRRKWFVRYQSQSAATMEAPLADTVVRYHHNQYGKTPNGAAATPLPGVPGIGGAGGAGDVGTGARGGESAREKVLAEILNTEVDYVNDLGTICSIFAEPLGDGELLTRRQHLQLFSNIVQLYEVNVKLLEQLKSVGGLERVGDIFLGMADYLKAYAFYCANQKTAFNTLDELNRSKNKDWHSFLAYCQSRPECFGMDLGSFLVKPMQRICKYPLLLRELLRATASTYAGYHNLKLALEKIEATVANVNERQRESEQTAKMIDVIQRIVCAPTLELLSPTRRFVDEGELVVESMDGKKRKRWYYFLFNDVLLFTKKKRANKFHLKAFLPFTDILIRESPGNPRVFEIEHLADRSVFTLLFNSEAERDDLLATVSDLVATYLQELYDLSNDDVDNTSADDVRARSGSVNARANENKAVPTPVSPRGQADAGTGALPASSAQPQMELRTYGKMPTPSPASPRNKQAAASTAVPSSERELRSYGNMPLSPAPKPSGAVSPRKGSGRALPSPGDGARGGRALPSPGARRGGGGAGGAKPTPIARPSGGSSAAKPPPISRPTASGGGGGAAAAKPAPVARPSSDTSGGAAPSDTSDRTSRARLALRRATVARGLADRVQPSAAVAAANGASVDRPSGAVVGSAAAFNAPEVQGNSDDIVQITSVFHDEHETYEIKREDVDFVDVRKRIHERHKLSVPRQFLVVKHRGRRIMNQKDLLEALGTDEKMRLDVTE